MGIEVLQEFDLHSLEKKWIGATLFPASFLPSLSLHCADGLPAGIARVWIAMKALPSTGQHCSSFEGPALLPSGVTWSQAEGPQEEPLPTPHPSLFSFPHLPTGCLACLPPKPRSKTCKGVAAGTRPYPWWAPKAIAP